MKQDFALTIHSYHGGEFKNNPFEIFCEEIRILPNFSSLRTLQQNGVVEKKNSSMQDMARTMIHELVDANHFWAEAINTACYIQNIIYIRLTLNKTSYTTRSFKSVIQNNRLNNSIK